MWAILGGSLLPLLLQSGAWRGHEVCGKGSATRPKQIVLQKHSTSSLKKNQHPKKKCVIFKNHTKKPKRLSVPCQSQNTRRWHLSVPSVVGTLCYLGLQPKDRRSPSIPDFVSLGNSVGRSEKKELEEGKASWKLACVGCERVVVPFQSWNLAACVWTIVSMQTSLSLRQICSQEKTLGVLH